MRGSHTKMVETPTLKRGTNTKITTENTTEITTNKRLLVTSLKLATWSMPNCYSS